MIDHTGRQNPDHIRIRALATLPNGRSPAEIESVCTVDSDRPNFATQVNSGIYEMFCDSNTRYFPLPVYNCDFLKPSSLLVFKRNREKPNDEVNSNAAQCFDLWIRS
jgi:hypothetical protein